MKTLIVLVLSVTLSLASAEECDFTDFASCSTEFSEDIYSELIVDNKDNIIVSPFSAEAILALTQSGAVGTTAEEIRTSLYLPETEKEIEALIQNVVPTFESEDYVVKTANKIYVEDNFEIKDTFKSVAKNVYQAAFENVEFSEKEEAAKTINSWVEEETNDLIHDLISPLDLDDSTRVVLVNALYFEANWTKPFIPALTKKHSFHSANKKMIDTDFMFIESQRLNYYENEELDAKMLELPFKGPNASMTFILPNKPDGIAMLEKRPLHVLHTPKYTRELVQVFLPKFKIETTIDFGDILQKLGVQAAFDSAVADFSGIAGDPGELVISKISQKAFIDVNEIGVQAAAATSVVVETSVPPPATQYFIADHPFMFYIKVNDIILFEGRVLEPKYE